MKLILRQYIASLRERDELDAVLPDLLSQLGLTVFSRPGRGTRQDGVDVAAVGRLKGEKEDKVYLFSVKPGDLTRGDWDGGGVQSLRPSLNQIMDVYIPNRMPAEHRNKKIEICICLGGDIQEQVRPDVEGFIRRETSPKVAFTQWNGDRLADLIERHFLREDLLPRDARPSLRKALAMLDEPASSYAYFTDLIRSLSAVDSSSDAVRLRAIRQIYICLWVLYAWGRDVGNLESPYRSGELAFLHAWHIARSYAKKKNKTARAVQDALLSILLTHQMVSSEYLSTRILPHVEKRDGLSNAVRSSSDLDVNLKLFDLLGRVAMKGLWADWLSNRFAGENKESAEANAGVRTECTSAIMSLISNNPVLLVPRKDDQAIDIWLAVSLLVISGKLNDIRNWLSEILTRSSFAYRTHGFYPCNLNSYGELLEHPKETTDEYRENATRGSILYPMIAFWAALLGFDDLYSEVANLEKEHLSHCNFQLWYPDDTSEDNLYTNAEAHGATLSPVSVNRPAAELLNQVFSECDSSPQFRSLSAVKAGLWPIILVACRHYRLPLPIHLFVDLHKEAN